MSSVGYQPDRERTSLVDPQETFRSPENGRSTIKIEACVIKIR